MKLDGSHLDDLALGAVFLATGGGGDPYVSKLLTSLAFKKYGPVTLIDVQDLDDDAHIVTIGGVGAPTVGLELLPSHNEAFEALVAYEKHTSKKVDALVSFEIGGGNSLVPILAALAKGIPVIDGDGMGRALPEAQMMTYAICGACPTPAIALDYEGNVTSFTTQDTHTYERHIRGLTQASGGMMLTVEHPMTGAFLKHAIIPGTMSFSVKLGALLRENRGSADLLLAPLKALFKESVYGECRLLYTGKVTDKQNSIVGGFDVGEVSITSFDEQQAQMNISIKNEYLVAKLGGKVVASVPDLIVIVEYETSNPINAERLRYGQRVAVFAIGCPAFYRSSKALDVVSPACFGFDLDYVPLADI
ncbi:DUF917 domain-containing protein [Paraglaciecola sp. 2405UD69-4]|uniref:DUF917 domain-containing protein n=1 Tax=Paraglaciecola sp. 2405UD69-4 TaxID=3391836 RepID=UPI0039C9E580